MSTKYLMYLIALLILSIPAHGEEGQFAPIENLDSALTVSSLYSIVDAHEKDTNFNIQRVRDILDRYTSKDSFCVMEELGSIHSGLSREYGENIINDLFYYVGTKDIIATGNSLSIFDEVSRRLKLVSIEFLDTYLDYRNDLEDCLKNN